MAEGEFDFIRNRLAPLASALPGSASLTNDGAILNPPAGRSLVVTADVLVEGVHFMGNESAASLAEKALAVNLSDLAAMGAQPWTYFMTLALRDREEAWLIDFVSGLNAAQERYAVVLGGGDTSLSPGQTTISITALGTTPQGQCLGRDGARANDRIWVSGTIGDAYLGLLLLQETIVGLSDSAKDFFTSCYQRPQPRVELGLALLEQGLATAALDVSDGLIADLGHILDESRVGARIDLAQLPVSHEASKLLAAGLVTHAQLASGGDDYELLFTAPKDKSGNLKSLASSLGISLTEIGQITEEEGLEILDERGKVVSVDNSGWRHF